MTAAAARLGGARAWRLLRPGFARHPGDLLRVALGSAVLALTTLAIHRQRIGSREAAVFRLVNDLDLPGWTYPGVWLVMQLGVIGAVPLVVALALATRRLRLALDAALAAGSIYLIAKLVKLFVQRGRPQTLLDGVHILGEPARGLGYVSGHSAVAVALATVASPYLGRRARRVAWTLAGLVCAARMYVGAHLPFDVLGGAALGWAAGGLVHLLLGAPEQRPSAGRVAAELRASGLDPDGLRPVGQNRRRSSSFVTDGGLFVKVVPSEWRDGDLLYRAWRRLLRRPRPPGFASALHEVEHEAAMALLAAAHGVRVPAVLLLRAFGNGAGLLVQRRVPGRPLADLGGQVGDELLRELWGQVGRLHAAGIAHGELDAGNVVVDDDGQPWLVDFGRASVAGERQRARDVADLLGALGPLVGPERAAAAARAAVGRDAVERALAAGGR